MAKIERFINSCYITTHRWLLKMKKLNFILSVSALVIILLAALGAYIHNNDQNPITGNLVLAMPSSQTNITNSTDSGAFIPIHINTDSISTNSSSGTENVPQNLYFGLGGGSSGSSSSHHSGSSGSTTDSSIQNDDEQTLTNQTVNETINQSINDSITNNTNQTNSTVNDDSAYVGGDSNEETGDENNDETGDGSHDESDNQNSDEENDNHVEVPEFGTIGALAVLAGAGAYIHNKRKKR